VTTTHKVIIVVDPAFGDRLAELPSSVPLWVVDTAINRSVAERLRRERTAGTHLTDIAIFHSDPGFVPEEILIGVLATVDLDHGHYSADPPYGELEVYGAADTPAVRSALARIGFEIAGPTGTGVLAVRRPSSSSARD
jgi:hypothetical protein